MRGTTKQIAWANDIRTKRLADLEKLEGLSIPLEHPAAKALAVIRAQYDAADHAGWWIAHEQTAIDVQGLANDIAKNKPVHWPTETSLGWE